MKKFTLTAMLAALPFTQSLALEYPGSSRFDSRVKYASYNPADVVQLDTVLGIATMIELEPGERYVTHAFGDSEAYSFSKNENFIFLKPRAEEANTNLILVTDKRTYRFRLSFKEVREGATYSLAFKYPDTRAKAQAEAKAKANLDKAFQLKSGNANLKYSMSGDTDIAPINVWDDGFFTYLKFSANQDMPTIYMVDEDGQESLVNFTVTGKSNQVLKVHKVYDKFYIRAGNRVLALYNEDYDFMGVPNSTGTSSPAVQRVIKGGNQ